MQLDPVARFERRIEARASAEDAEREAVEIEAEAFDDIAGSQGIADRGTALQLDADARGAVRIGMANLDLHDVARPFPWPATASARLTKLSTIDVAIWWNTGPTSPPRMKLLNS